MRVLRAALLLLLLIGLGAAVAAETPVLFAGSSAPVVDRVSGYEVGVGTDPEFALPGGDTLVRLVTNTLVPATLAGEDASYAFLVDIVRPGQAVETHPIHLESHRTGARTGSLDPCFTADGTPVADSRHIDLTLVPPAEPGTVLRLHGAGAIPTLVRAWSWQPREGVQRARRLLALDPAQRQQLGAPIGLLSWDHLADDERARWTSGHFARLAASGRPGREHIARDFFVRGVQPSEEEGDIRPVALQSPLTWLVQGPTTASLTLTPTAATVEAHVSFARVSTEESPLGSATVGPSAPATTWAADVPAGLHTLVVRTDVPTTLGLALSVPGTALVPAGPSPLSEVAAPSTVTLHATPIGPGVDAVVDAALPRDPEARTLEVEVWGEGEADPTITLTTTSGRRVTVEQVRPVLSANPYDVVVDDWGVERALRGPARLKVLLAPDAVDVRVSADVPALVRFRMPFHVSDEDPGPPPTTRQVGVAEGPAARSWVRPRTPAEEATILLKARLEPVPAPPPPPANWLPISLDPVGMAQRFEVLERIGGDLVGRLLTEVTAARPVRLRAGSGQTKARWSFEVSDDALLGTSVPYTLDGQPAGSIRAALSRGTVRLPPLTPGEHTVSASPAAGIRLFVNLPPAAGDPAPAYRARTVWRFGETVRLTVTTDARGPRALNIVVYDPSTEARADVSLTATVDGGTPRRRDHGTYTRATPARRTWTLPPAATTAAATLVDGDRASIGFARTLILPLGDDLEPGRHTLVLTPSRDVHARFFVVTPPGLSSELPSFTEDQEPPP